MTLPTAPPPVHRVELPVFIGREYRAPYFHNGSAATLFRCRKLLRPRFSIGFTDQQKSDLVAFLNALQV
jgi:cytochrome c peroxidase